MKIKVRTPRNKVVSPLLSSKNRDDNDLGILLMKNKNIDSLKDLKKRTTDSRAKKEINRRIISLQKGISEGE